MQAVTTPERFRASLTKGSRFASLSAAQAQIFCGMRVEPRGCYAPSLLWDGAFVFVI